MCEPSSPDHKTESKLRTRTPPDDCKEDPDVCKNSMVEQAPLIPPLFSQLGIEINCGSRITVYGCCCVEEDMRTLARARVSRSYLWLSLLASSLAPWASGSVQNKDSPHSHPTCFPGR